MTQSDESYFLPGLVSLEAQLETLHGAGDDLDRFAILTLRGPSQTMQRVRMTHEQAHQLGRLLVRA